MDYNKQLKLQAFLDGELPEREARAVASEAAHDRESAALLEELRNTRGALAGFEAEVRLPESREFFWSKIKRQVERLETPASEPAPLPFFALVRRFLVPASAFALVFIAGVVLTRPTALINRGAPADSETALAEAHAFTYRDFSAGTTLVWVSYPADDEIAPADRMGTVN